jgi:(S)-2-hydroxyglutarate dehydrogenase
MHCFDYTVIGGGIVGLSVASAIIDKNPRVRVAVVEKESSWASHQSGRNSGVIHSGIYYKPGSLKAKLCREGGQRMRQFCDRYNIRYENCGKLIAATTPAELPLLGKLYERAVANGISVQKLSSSAAADIEPHVSCLEALWVPSTGIVDYVGVCEALVGLIQSRGGELRLGTKVVGLQTNCSEAVVETSNGPVRTRWVVNCAGLHSDRVARSAGVNPEARIVPFRGEYYELKPSRRALVRGLIYPVPDPTFPFLGVHFTRMIDGSVHAGPNAVLSLKREGYSRTSFNARDFVETMTYPGFWRLAARHANAGLNEIHRSFSKKAFVNSLRSLIPEVNEDDLIPASPGVRAQALRRDGGLVDDFLIVQGPCSIHICNAPSPAATASLEIGREIVARLPESK